MSERWEDHACSACGAPPGVRCDCDASDGSARRERPDLASADLESAIVAALARLSADDGAMAELRRRARQRAALQVAGVVLQLALAAGAVAAIAWWGLS